MSTHFLQNRNKTLISVKIYMLLHTLGPPVYTEVELF